MHFMHTPEISYKNLILYRNPFKVNFLIYLIISCIFIYYNKIPVYALEQRQILDISPKILFNITNRLEFNDSYDLYIKDCEHYLRSHSDIDFPLSFKQTIYEVLININLDTVSTEQAERIKTYRELLYQEIKLTEAVFIVGIVSGIILVAVLLSHFGGTLL